ncbi:MAG: GDYXXLXY domain-containing protein [Candidatus Woesearchaeota archaeon]
MKKDYKRLIVILIILVGIACSFIFYLSFPLISGKTMTLATRPVDPFDVFRGQYMAITYEISTIPSIEAAREGDTVYVVLQEDSAGIWRYLAAYLDKPQSGDFIRGEINSIHGGRMSVEYGIEQFFFERDARISAANMTVVAKVSSSGQARISKLLSNGKQLEIDYSQTN